MGGRRGNCQSPSEKKKWKRFIEIMLWRESLFGEYDLVEDLSNFRPDGWPDRERFEGGTYRGLDHCPGCGRVCYIPRNPPIKCLVCDKIRAEELTRC